MFETLESFGTSLFADEGAIWKRGRKVGYLMKQMQSALDKMQDWSDKWGFRLLVTKKQNM